ncbi:hypothetical protein K458DRAFT_351886 [Lentithecium fluviatile CBS 122367]|uniref:Rhodopsin domain-containing protein n=1 Tax=Lentithecium fluviatile CBS 122367 TaxID=1168545 RepID=A0A6G1IDK2_9PLEO|nr:hypothetical protein K458DRAFT_351886 [Lentithecium fluviatile CBS 122367]
MAASTAPVEETYLEFRARFDGAIITTYAVAMVVVPLKVWCRKRTGGWQNMGWDELFTLIATLSVSGVFWIVMTNVRPLLGMRFASVMQSPELFAKVPDFALCLWIANLLYVPSVCGMKLSIVALYWKLFGIDFKSKLPLIAIGTLISMWFVGVLATVIFACTPIAGSYDIALAATAKCIDKKQFYLGASTPNVITDVILVIMPIPYVWRLHAPIAQRVVLAGIFALGAFVSIVSIVRLSVLLETASGVMDLTYTFKDVYLWSLVEINVGLICVCLPSLRPMIRIMGLSRIFSFSSRSRPSANTPDPYRGLSKGDRSGLSASRKKTNSFFGTNGGTRIGDEDEFEMIGKQERMEGKGATWTAQTASRVSYDTDNASHESAASRQQAGLGQGITVQREWDVSTHTRP